MRRLVLLLTLLTGMVAAQAADVTDAQRTIRAQEQAFIRDDATAAYGYAAPSIREIFPNPEIFMGMVRDQYTPVYRHRSFEFGDSKVEGDWIAQKVDIVDAGGEAWEALYTLEVQPDGSLKITGCTLLKRGQSA